MNKQQIRSEDLTANSGVNCLSETFGYNMFDTPDAASNKPIKRLYLTGISFDGTDADATMKLVDGGESEKTEFAGIVGYFEIIKQTNTRPAFFSMEAYIRIKSSDVKEINAKKAKSLQNFKVKIDGFNKGQILKEDDHKWGPIISGELDLVSSANVSELAFTSYGDNGTTYRLELNNFEIQNEEITFTGPETQTENVQVELTDSGAQRDIS